MRMSAKTNSHTILPIFIKVIGFVQLIVGIVALYYGPLEIYVFYLFSEGGQFHFPGFGVGSVWFAVLVAHNIAYYILAAMLLPLGIGSIRLKRWALPLSQAYLWLMLAAGVLFTINLLFLFPVVYDVNVDAGTAVLRFILVLALASLLLIVLPSLLLIFYRSSRVADCPTISRRSRSYHSVQKIFFRP